MVSVYVPNGRSLDSEHYLAKLAWLARLRTLLDETTAPDQPCGRLRRLQRGPRGPGRLGPEPIRGHDPCQPPERDALAELEPWGLVDVFRRLYDEEGLFSWWDYRGGSFHRHRGMRIDLILVTAVLAARTTFGLIDRNARKGEKPSDHAPVFIDTTRSARGLLDRGGAEADPGVTRPRPARISAIIRPVSRRRVRPVPARDTRATAASQGDGCRSICRPLASRRERPTSSGDPARPG